MGRCAGVPEYTLTDADESVVKWQILPSSADAGDLGIGGRGTPAEKE
ncbi:MAG: hypothetical protein ACLU9X_10355 [Alistipes shahii]